MLYTNRKIKINGRKPNLKYLILHEIRATKTGGRLNFAVQN